MKCNPQMNITICSLFGSDPHREVQVLPLLLEPARPDDHRARGGLQRVQHLPFAHRDGQIEGTNEHPEGLCELRDGRILGDPVQQRDRGHRLLRMAQGTYEHITPTEISIDLLC